MKTLPKFTIIFLLASMITIFVVVDPMSGMISVCFHLCKYSFGQLF